MNITSDIHVELTGKAGLITLNRPRALNALSLDMVRGLTAALLQWQDDPRVEVVMIRGMGREGPFGAFCAGGDIRFFHQAVLAGDPRLEDFFTEEYALNHLVHRYPKPYIAFLDGIVMGGGMGIAGHGAANAIRMVTERTKMAMPETNIGLFPDVGGGWFLGRCPGAIGEYLALTGEVIGGTDAVAVGLADRHVASDQLPVLWDRISREGMAALDAVRGAAAAGVPAPMLQTEAAGLLSHAGAIDRIFGLPGVTDIITSLEGEGARGDAWAADAAQVLRKRSPLMLHVVLEQVRRARGITLAEELRMERGMVRQCFTLRPGAASETVEGIRALAVDKDHAPGWNPARIEQVTGSMVAPFFESPWPDHAHPLASLA